MPKTCPACQAENRDDAQFCRICGTPFPLIPAAPTEASNEDGVTCSECGFVNRPGVRYCAKCGVNLMGTVVLPRSQRTVPPASTAHAPPAWSPPPEPSSNTYPPPFDPLPIPDVPDPHVAIDAERAADADATVIRPASGVGFRTEPVPPPARRTGLWAAIAVALVVAGGVAWYFLESSPSAPPAARPVVPVRPVEPAASSVDAAASSTNDGAATATMPAAPAASVNEAAPPAPAVATPPPVAAPPPTAALPPSLPSSPVAASADDERLAAERRARLARERAERETRAKAAAAEREQAAARQRADQEAARRADDQQRQRAPAQPYATPAPATTTPNAARGRTVADICGDRSLISRSMCESRECGAPEHAGEALCRRVRENEERRRDRLN